MAYVVMATMGSSGNRRRITSRRFKTRAAAQRFADATNRDRPGSNARVTEV